MLTNIGWICPRCNKVFSPSITECPYCNGKYTFNYTVTTFMNKSWRYENGQWNELTDDENQERLVDEP